MQNDSTLFATHPNNTGPDDRSFGRRPFGEHDLDDVFGVNLDRYKAADAAARRMTATLRRKLWSVNPMLTVKGRISVATDGAADESIVLCVSHPSFSMAIVRTILLTNIAAEDAVLAAMIEAAREQTKHFK